MSVYNAGLPQATATSGGSSIGDMSWLPESGDTVVKADGSVWLRSGSFLPASAYPAAAQLEHLKVSGLLASNSANITVIQAADNGAGSVVVTTGSTSVLVSTDWGASYSLVNPGLGLPVHAVAWVAASGRFIIAGNDGATSRLAWSTTGTSYTAGANGPSGTLSGQIRAAATANQALFVVQNGSTATAVTTVDGATATPRAISIGAQPAVYAGGNTFVILQSGSPGAYWSADGVTFNSFTLPATYGQAAWAAGSWMFMTNTPAYHTTSDFSGWKARTLPFNATLIGQTFFRLSHDASRAYLGFASSYGAFPALAWSNDGINWRLRWLSVKPAISQAWYCHAGRYVLPHNYAVSTILRIPDFNQADYVGVAAPVYDDYSNLATSAVGYLRVK
ncbi:hypothetical protein SAMN02745857_02753 [Andreprevotia lacus DSM 23236]|jgi:hypothetical protein|uniref:Uncharacterized protein n=1 Tax=Andreprevotia lacus DSM 23236 TaxID=1121001 RepID=A0A1W1XTC6_9NEIS|nr:hypothetical protein [Andreprevotia lacus]SMC27213.1 hypothetical protein SAMN02745857_02753 [Andreprevotia lacus DSM 23236]